VLGYNRNDEGAGVDLVPDFLMPRIPAPQLILIEEDPDADRTERGADPLGHLDIL
jgi:hypothetical protein